ncbi:MAG: BON domain-containing protein [Ottowia sp.]|nr:BON domain-containing protein [Ottowia sp.]
MKRTTWQAAVAAVCAALALAGCMEAALIGGAAGAGVLLYSGDRRSSETSQADSALEKAGEEAVKRLLGERGRVVVTSYFRRVLLTGEVPTQADWQAVDAAVRALPDAQGVFNELAVMENAGMSQRSSDTLITSRVRTKLLNQNGVPSGAVKVLTERGTTYLMGRLTAGEADLTTEAARSAEGVQRVVRIIDLIAEAPGGGVDGVITPLGSQKAPQSEGLDAGEQLVPDAATGVQTHPVTQTPVVQQPAAQPIEVKPLPPVQ